MESPAPKINFYRERTFGEKLNTTFDYLRHSWRPLLRYSLYFILPLCLVQAFFLNQLMSNNILNTVKRLLGQLEIKFDLTSSFMTLAPARLHL